MTRQAIVLSFAVFFAVGTSVISSPYQSAAKRDTAAPSLPEAPAGFDNKSNGMVDDPTHAADLVKFDDVETIADGLGPLYNAQSCRECHQNPTSGGASQVTELRVGIFVADRKFRNPDIPINHGAVVISGRTLVNDRAICPSGAYPDTEIQEHVPDGANVRTLRVSLNVLGDGFIEAIPDQTLIDISHKQCTSNHGEICGAVIYVPIVEANSPPQAGIGKFGWKDQHASLLSFSGDAYLNEMGITTNLFPEEVTTLCNTATEPNDQPGPDGLADVDHFARFIRASKPPVRDSTLAQTASATQGAALFDKIGCAVCHVTSLTTALAGTKINGGAYTVPPAIGGKTFHPYSDLLMHDVGTGDGIVIPVVEHYGRATRQMPRECTRENFDKTRLRLRTPPLWGVRLRTRLMHDGVSVTLRDALVRHHGEANRSARAFEKLTAKDQEALLDFLRSL
jgi:CxxC motif-containing protein (DUF1111 family)